MITIPFWIGTIVACTLIVGAGGINFIRNSEARKHQKQLDKIYLDEAKIIETEASLIYEDICLKKPILEFQDNIDLALLIALMNNYDLNELTAVNSINVEDLNNIIGYIPTKSKEVSVFIVEAIQKRIKELYDAEYSVALVPINFQSIATSLEHHSNTVKYVIENAKNTKSENINKEIVFYNHNYPQNENGKVLKKTL